MSILLENHTIQGIPTLIMKPSEPQACPVIFFIPGHNGTKEAGLQLGYKLAERGFYFLSFDPLYHGERYDRRLIQASDPALGGIYPPDMGMDILLTMYRVIQQCLEDTRTLIGHLAFDSGADVSRCGVIGLSMGGYASYTIFANLQQMQAAVPMIGLPQFTRRWQDLLDESAFSNPNWASALEGIQPQVEAHTHFIEEIDPYSKLKEAAPRALFIMNCDFDADQPKQYAVYAYRELLPFYQSSPQNLKLRIYPTGHEVTAEMENDAVEWFYQHLLRS